MRDQSFAAARCFRTLDWAVGVSLLALLTLSSCGGGLPGLAPSIVTEPASVSTPLGQIATFTVTTSGMDCEWVFFGFNPATGATGPTSLYSNDSFSNLDMDLSSLASGQTVITSLDLEPVNQFFAYGALQVAQACGFEFSSQTVSPGQLQATATQLGEQSCVITASGQVSCALHRLFGTAGGTTPDGLIQFFEQ